MNRSFSIRALLALALFIGLGLSCAYATSFYVDTSAQFNAGLAVTYIACLGPTVSAYE